MSWDWADSFDQIWKSPALPMWLSLAIVGFVGLILLVALLRAERSVANGTLAVLTVAAIAIAIVVFLRDGSSNDPVRPAQNAENASSLPALACLDNLAGETVLTACEKMLFSSPDMAAAAVAYTASQLNRLKAHGDVANANRTMTPDLQALRRALERDRYGLVAYVLSVRDLCQPAQCLAFASMTDHNQISVNMTERTYEAAIDKYAASWNAPPSSPGSASLMAPTQPTGKPTNADFPTSSSIPPVNIMTPEPPLAAPRAPAPTAQPATPRPAASAAPPAPAQKKQPAAPKKQPSPAPVQLAPPASSTAPAARDQ